MLQRKAKRKSVVTSANLSVGWTRQRALVVLGIACYSTVWLVRLGRFELTTNQLQPTVPRPLLLSPVVSVANGSASEDDAVTPLTTSRIFRSSVDSSKYDAIDTTASPTSNGVHQASVVPSATEVELNATQQHSAHATSKTRNELGLADSDPVVPPPAKAPHKFESSSSEIPKIIHQSWKSADRIPSKFVPWMQSWRVHNPTWSYMFWDDVDNLNLFEIHYPKYASVARQVGKIHLADMTRYALLHHYGGVYADGDFESLKPFDDLMHMDLFLSFEPLAHSVLLEGATSPVLCNAILASIPGHPFWLEVLDNILATFDGGNHQDPVSLTGPRMVQHTMTNHDRAGANLNQYGIVLLDEEYFYPEVAYWNMDNLRRKCTQNQSQSVQQACAWLSEFPNGRYTNNTHAVHHWQCTWCRGDDTASYVSLQDIFPNQDIRRP
ncbi:hypothetical protein DYB26_009039 [Aphanomyces astaci]|uniref:Alpha 1,4-glycosyltransferase domain-containing protein n=1 Tax=Aphanomyces astaci TaxID=112090 RepID=A0A397F1D9_APHAT|nr:hypothetical protein DYB38_004616 [Aphanomyces astaci]RHY82827.1 hypothetical protein DYB26_009039 [Aphanomyces astaci]RHZ07582.1 hypothetical protein DYB31_010085 [Aphanomyces astaci]